MFSRFLYHGLSSRCIKKTSMPFNGRDFSQMEKKKNFNDWVKNVLENSTISSSNDWKVLRQQISQQESNRGEYSLDNIDTSILNYCLTTNTNLGLSYIDFMTTENIKKNLATIGKHLKLVYLKNKNYLLEGKKCPDSQEKVILKSYNNLRKEYPILDPSTLETSILALSLTSEWKKCFEILKDIQITSSPSNQTYCAIAGAAFLNDEPDLAWQILNNMLSEDRVPTSLPFLTYISLAKNSPAAKSMLERLLCFFQETDFICTEDIIFSLSHLVKTASLHCSQVEVRKFISRLG